MYTNKIVNGLEMQYLLAKVIGSKTLIRANFDYFPVGMRDGALILYKTFQQYVPLER